MACPNCHKQISSGNLSLDRDQADLINERLALHASGYCMSCGADLYAEALRSRGQIDRRSEREPGAEIERPSPGPRDPMLPALGVVFYLAAALNVVAILLVDDGGPLVTAVFAAGALSALFFGAISFAASDIRDTLRRIEANLRR